MAAYQASHRTVFSTHPLNAEPDIARLGAHTFTPQDMLYVRSHGTQPELNSATHRLSVDGLVERPLTLSLEALKTRFPSKSVDAVLQCAGNRRADHHAHAPVSGDPWAGGAIGQGRWTGVPLKAVLDAAGVSVHEGHVAFYGLDDVEMEDERFQYGVSIPLEKALDDDTLLAWAVNGEPLRPEHGYPLRVIVPGVAGVRSAKWVHRIEVRETEADTPIQRRDYKLLPPHMSLEQADWSQGIVINEMPLNALICSPRDHARLPAGRQRIEGYAIANGRSVARVDVSPDGGAHWHQAALTREPDARWGWTLWQVTLEFGPGTHEVVVRAFDGAGQTQPEHPGASWNAKGYLCASWHRITLTVE
ncbi:sulfite oxidase [Larsenimonas salina]|uniref:sulfite oxidase n=1 Tax=Larsenimonas salina TaxID=1295565 RepID=UPI0020730937|nr:sulfite oxidase [Larsenimonas salina]MCM5704524.1 sulfite oxidase [Larsenimonas salina]